MSHAESPGGKSNPVGMAIAIAVGTLMLVVGIILLAKYAVGTHSVGKDTKAATPEAVTERIAP
ncbi:MAG: hypothetical protein JNJ51_10490, partial [Methylobacillus glycogenes]|nr:hypothetical protein [Methylobacillus glycogenes]